MVGVQIVDKTIMEADQDKDGKISFDEFKKMVENTDVSMSMTLGKLYNLSSLITARLPSLLVSCLSSLPSSRCLLTCEHPYPLFIETNPTIDQF